MSNLKGAFGWKGSDGDSAYIVAVKNGYVGTEQDWLATLGTSAHFTQNKTTYTSTTASQTIFDLPEAYTSNSFLDIYIEGEKLRAEEYSVNTTTRKITLTTGLEVVGTKVEVEIITMSTNALPIVTTIDNTSTDETAPSTKSVYDKLVLKEDLSNKVTSLSSSSTNTQYPSAKSVYDGLETKLNSANIQVLTGNTVSSIPAGEGTILDVSYPTGFTKSNTIIIGKMCSSNNVYYDTERVQQTTNGFPVISMVALNDSVIRIWFENNSSSQSRIGYYKITLLKY